MIQCKAMDRPADQASPPVIAGPGGITWRRSTILEPYPEAVTAMEAMVAGIRAGGTPETVWLLEHPPLYTAGTSARASDLLDADRLPVFQTGRGGEYTYHGPGQRVAYVMLDLRRRGGDLRQYVWSLEEWIIRSLDALGVAAERRCGRVGIWIDRGNGRDDKIASIGVRVRRWVSYHGISVNLDPDLSHFAGIVPCGIHGHGVTSLADLGVAATMRELDAALMKTWPDVFDTPAPRMSPDPA